MKRSGTRQSAWGLQRLSLTAQIFVAACLLMTTSCNQPPTLPAADAARQEVVIAGAADMYPLMRDLVTTYKPPESWGELRLDEARRDGMEAVRAGDVEIGLLARDLSAEELADEELQFVPIALDAIVIAVHASNPIQGLSLDQLRRIYGGQVANWDNVGGQSMPMEILGRPEGADSRSVIESKVMHGQEITLEALLAPTGEAVDEYISTHPAAIGYCSMACLNQGGKAIAVEGIQPNPRAIESSAYPLTRPLYLVTKAEPPDLVQAFLAFCLSPDGQRIVARHHVRVR